jgi:Cys-rich repeat protein
VCVECLSDDNCTEGQFCDEGVCRFPCQLFIKYKEIRAEKLTKDRKWLFTVTGEEDFDLFGLIDFGPFTWRTVKFNARKDRLKIIATVPAGLAPGVYPVSVGECSGEIVVTGNDS